MIGAVLHLLMRAGGYVLIKTRLAQILAPPVVVTHIDIAIDDLPPSLSGFTIAQISDLHVGRGLWKPHHIDTVIEALRAARPDVVVNTGDYLQGTPRLGPVVQLAAALTVPGGRDRNLAIMGNHDYF